MDPTRSQGNSGLALLSHPASVTASIQRVVDEHGACRAEVQRLAAENARLAAELSHAHARHDDLKRSTEIWIWLYETHLRRERIGQPAAAPDDGRQS